MMIFIIIPVFNRKVLLYNCLDSLRNQTNQNFQVIVVDDGSTDGTSDMLRENFPKATVLKGDGNLWWTGATNVGVLHALPLCQENDFIMALNDDLVVGPDYIEMYYQLAATHPDTLIGSVVTDINNRDIIYSGGVKINWITAKTRNINVGKSLASYGTGYYEEVSILTGRGVLFPSKVFRKIGMYNDKHYAQCGDTELPRRAQLAGFRLIVSYDVPVFSVVQDEGHINYIEKFKFSHIKKYYFNIRSNSNLRYRFWFAYDATPNVIQGTIFFVCDFLRITNHFMKRFRF
ncbi:MAG: glycosyltransferase family 2 protein [Bacteroidota bacterium]